MRQNYFTRTVLKRLRPLVLWIGIAFSAQGQTAPTYIDWVKVNQTYVQIKVGRNGVYRLPATSLSPYFPNLASMNAAGFQLFRRGKEQAILVNAGTDNLLNGNDYIDFMGLMNDAASEYEMYQKPMAAINEYRSLYDDTAHYFLTYTPDLNGKRVTNNGVNNNTSVTFETYAWRTAATFQHKEYAHGQSARGESFSSYFTPGEGWTGLPYSLFGNNQLTGNQANAIRISGISNVYGGGPKPSIEILEVGRQDVPHLLEVLAGTNNVLVDTFTFAGRTSRKFTKSIDGSLIEGSELPLRVHVLTIPNIPPQYQGNVSLSYALLKYPATFDMPNGMVNTEMELPVNPNGYSRMRFSNLGNTPELYDYTDPLNPIRVGVAFFSGQYVAGVENTTSPRKLCIQPQPFTVGSGGLKAFSFTSFLPQSFNYVIVSNPKIRKSTGGVSDPVEAYAEFRRSVAGGSHKVLVLNMDEVYSRFGYGDHTPMSLRNLCGYFVQNNSRPKALFLIGKGINLPFRYDGYYYSNNLVPTFGSPSSDNTFTVGLGEPERTIAFPVGRLAASKPEHVLTYLDKVKETEAFQYNDLWKKNMFHISGGINPAEQSQFKTYINSGITPTAQNKYMGAKVGLYNKTSLNNVQPVDIRKVLNNGISLLTLFGHSSSSTSDVDIGLVSDPSQGINNVGKYPIVIINGCFAGDIYNYEQTLSENWIFTPNKGAALFWAATDVGYSALLGRHIQTFYKTAFADSAMFGKSMGEIQKEAMRVYLQQFSSSPQLDSAFMHQFTIHGDPVLRIFGAYKPDYKTSNSEIFLNSTNPSATDPSLKIGVVASNFGRFTGDSLSIGVKRTLGSGEVITNLFLVKSVAYKDTFLLDLPNLGASNFAGINKIEVFLDFLHKEDEMDETNNTGLVEFFLPTAGILPLFPRDYAVVSSRNVRFVAQASSLFTQDRKYLFQLDTSASFNSPMLRQSGPIVAGNLGTWNATLPLNADSTVYFWRVKFQDQQSNIDTAWYRRSFEYIDNSPPGWSQSQFYQFRKSTDDGLQKDYVTRRWNFPSTTLNIDLKVSGGGKNSPRIWELKLNGSSILSGTSGTNCYKPGYASVCGVHFDQNTLLPQYWNYHGFPELYYDAGCGRVPLAVNAFHFPVGDGSNMTTQFIDDYIKRIVPVGDYVLLFSVDSTFFESIPDTVVSAIQNIGIYQDSIDKVKNGNPFIFFGRVTKNPSPGQGDVVLASPLLGRLNDQTISFNKTLIANSVFGTITSTKIGPASKWGKLFNKMTRIETPVFDKTSLQIIGSTLQGRDTVLVDQVSSFPFDLSSISADSYPYLTLKAFVRDSAYRTPALLKRWMVTYDGVPEGVINTSIYPASEYKVGKLDEGDSLGFRFAFSNISEKDFTDSVKVRYSVNNGNYQFKNLGKLPKDSTVRFKVDKFSTLGKSGFNSFQVFVNPRLQPEEYFENNVVEIPYNVATDKTNPLLDVTFDGVKIMNGDFVSPEPLISVALKDENKYLLKGDTAGMTLLLTRPCAGCQIERIALNSPQVKLFPAGKDNLFRLEYKPGKLENGNYRLAVQGSDVKGNESGSSTYQVDFQVVNESTITNFYPYPNPFSTSCQWVFTMTGQTFPEDFKIQIMTVTGRVVREIFKTELGPLKIGNNVTQYRWNATDDFGDRLANGVYLYRVVMKEGSNFAQRTTAADGNFTKGFGKLYIIR